MNQLSDEGFVRLKDIIGDRKKGIPALLPISRSTFWLRVRSGAYPKGVLLGSNIRAWRVREIRALMNEMSSSQAGMR
jgi:prophage regulatory protein